MSDVDFNQLNCVDPVRREACGETCDADVATDYGIVWTPDEVIAWLRGQGYSVDQGTPFDAHTAFFAHIGIPTRWIGVDDITAAANAGNHVMVLIHDDDNANPSASGPFEHYVLVIAVQSGADDTDNPWGGRYVAYPIQQMRAAFIAALEIVRPAQLAGTEQPQSSTSLNEEDIMAKTAPLPYAGGQHVFSVSSDGKLYHKHGQLTPAGWSGWSNDCLTDQLKAPETCDLTDGPATAVMDGALHVTIRGTSSRVLHFYFDTTWHVEQLP